MAKHLPAEQWYPASDPWLAARTIRLHTGERVRVVEGGPPDAEPLLLLHGWGCSAYVWRLVLGALVRRGIRVAALDLRGHGLSDKPLDPVAYTGDAMAQFVVDALDALEIGVAAVAGHSMGGGIALDVASRWPERIRALTLLAPVGFGPVRMISLAATLTPDFTRQIVRRLPPRWTIPVVLRLVHGSRMTRDARDIDEYWAPTAFPEFPLAMRLLLHHYRWRVRTDEELAALRMPVSVLFGGRDRLLDVRQCVPRAKVFWPSGVRVASNAGHVLMEEVPNEVLDLIA